MRLYVNGEESGSAAHRSTWPATGEVHVGNGLFNDSYQNHWLGGVDEVQLHDRVVSQTELLAVVSGNNVQVAHWTFDEATDAVGDPGTTARNSVDGGDMAVLTEGASFVREGAVKGAVTLDGSDDTVTTHQPTVRTDQSFSVAAWVRLDRVDQNYYAVLSQDGAHSSGFNLEYQGANRRWAFVMPHADEAQPSGYDTARSTSSPIAGEWTHLVASYDAAAGRMLPTSSIIKYPKSSSG